MRYVLRAMHLPLDVVFLTIDFCRALAFDVSRKMLSPANVPDLFRCGSRDTAEGRPACLPARKYGNLALFRLLCPGARVKPNTREAYYCAKEPEFKLSCVRMLSLGAGLLVLWSGIALGVVYARHRFPRAYRALTAGGPAGVAARRGPGGRAPGPTEVSEEAKAEAARYIESAAQLAADGRHQDAVIQYRNAVQSDPSNPNAHLGLGRCYQRLGNGRLARRAFADAVRLDPASTEAHLHLGHIALAERDLKRAMAHAKAARELSPKDPETCVLLGSCRRLTGDLAGAIKELEAAVALDDTDPALFVSAAALYFLRQDLANAERCYRRALDLDLDRQEARVGLAQVLRVRGRRDQAMELVNAVLKKDPANVGASVQLAELSVAAGDVPRALTEYRRIVKRHPNHLLYGARLAELAVRAGRADEAYSVASQLLRDRPGYGPAHVVLADLYLRQGLHSLAVEHARKALVADGKNVSARKLLARAHIAKGEYKEAVYELDQALKSAPGDVEMRLMLGIAHRALKDYDRALACFQYVAARKPQSPVPHVHVGMVHTQRGDVPAAIRSYETALKLAPQDLAASDNLAMLLADTGRDVKRAVSMAQANLARQPRNVTLMDTLGWAWLKHGQQRKAMPLLNAAAAGRPGNAMYRYHCGAACALTGKPAQAESHLKAALTLAPEAAWAAEARRLLKRTDEGPGKDLPPRFKQGPR